jgi:murein L,D-transpeptidase YafK
LHLKNLIINKAIGPYSDGSAALKSWSPHLPSLLALASCVAIVLAGCQTDSPRSRALKPLSPQMLALLDQKRMPKESPILIRLFKQESEVEVWKQNTSGRFALLKTYPICRWSGELGPKTREGDRQAPEGFYTVTPAQMNPNSRNYLSFDIGYPNAYDRAFNRTGSNIMVHGDCSSRGCYAMTDEQISEIYALARESFLGNQQSFQVQAYPFRMTPLNMAKHRNNPNMPFWKMLKEGNDHFEVTHVEPKINVCEGRYVFDAEPVNGSPANEARGDGSARSRWIGASAAATTVAELTFSPTGWCPAYSIPNEIAAAVAEKNRRDEIQTSELVSHGTLTVPVRTGRDGGMHPVFRTGVWALNSSDVD